MSNPEPLKTNFETNKIKQFVAMLDTEIKLMIKNKKTDPFEHEIEIMTNYPDFYQEYPSLVKKLCKQDDMSMLYKMLDSLESIQTGQKSLAGAELTLGEELATKYLYPNVKK